MSSSTVTPFRPAAEARRRTRGAWRPDDQAMALLFRLVLADDWSPRSAAAELRHRVGDPIVLQRVALRVRRAVDDRRSEVGTRAEQTILEAIDGHVRPLAPGHLALAA